MSSSAAFRPISGSAPAPRPRVSSRPSCIFIGARHLPSACRSVLTAMNSMPRSWASIMRLTALPPPPPTPITLIRAGGSAASSSRVMPRRRGSVVVVEQDHEALPCALCRVACAYSRSWNISRRLPITSARRASTAACRCAPCASRRCGRGAAAPTRCDQIGLEMTSTRPPQPARQAGAPGVEDLLGDLEQAVELRAAAGEHDAAAAGSSSPTRCEVVADQVEDLLAARLQDLGQLALRHHARRAAAHRRAPPPPRRRRPSTTGSSPARA